MTRVGFVGLGLMGRGMAQSILRAGYNLTVYDIDAAAAAPLLGQGASQASNVGELARTVDVLFMSLPGPAQIEHVVYGHDGILENASNGFVVFDLSTSSRSLSQRMASDFEEVGARLLDAPVSGGPAGAESGDLAIWVGGDREAYSRYEDLLKSVGRQTLYVGDTGAGNVVKLTHNLLGFMLWEALAEVFSIGVKAGVDPLELWKALRVGSAGKRSPLDHLTNQFLPGDYDTPAFALRLAHKDATLGTALAAELGVPVRLATLVREEMTEAMTRGYGERDVRSFLTLQLERSGTEVAVEPQRIQQAIAEL